MGHQFINLKWQDPLQLAQKISDNCNSESFVFLYSALHNTVKDSLSYLAVLPKQKIICDDFYAAKKIIKNSDEKWFGYISYEAGNQFEKLPETAKSFITLPKIWLINFAVILEFDHDKKILRATCDNQKQLEEILSYKSDSVSNDAERTKLSPLKILSNFSDESYLAAIEDIKNKIAAGDFYQTNLTRKFFGNFAFELNGKNSFDLFTELTKISPANYSAFLKLDENYIISSSPELFLFAKNNEIFSRPIKGTAPRGDTVEQDHKNKSALKNSSKETAENLMIVDLVRNDLSRICEAGSISVQKLFHITTYEKIHHMSSEIHGKISAKNCALDSIATCFPPGSMTGAPKIKAMEVAAQKEKIDRGIYSGSIGIFSRDKINCSVVIRTLILQKDKFEFQVGGAITFDSDANSELEEIFNKASGILELLKIKL